MTIELVIRYAVFIVGLHALLYWVYFLQLKEYRFDRFKNSFDTIHDVWKVVKDQWNLRRWYRPKATLRALLTLVFGFFFFVSVFLLLPLAYILFGLLCAPLAATLGVCITGPISSTLKRVAVLRAKQKMRQYKGLVIGITGSVGKTSTKELLAWVLGSSFRVEKTMHNDNSEIGVARTVLRMRLDSEIFIVEMGAYRRGEIKSVCEIVHPEVGIITAIGDQHLGLFGSLENLRKAKFELIDSLPKDGLRVVIPEDIHIEEAKDVHIGEKSLNFLYKNEKIAVPVLGRGRLATILAVIKIAEYLKIPFAEIKRSLESFPLKTLYPKLHNGKKGGFVIDDTYNSSRESFISALEYLSTFEDKLKIVVTPGIIELGKRAREDHEYIGKLFRFADKVLVTNPNFFLELNASGNARLIPQSYDLVRELEEYMSKDTVVLFEGRVSKGILEVFIQTE